jgi:RNA:NAD 2'-phosphotransferase (TPT1/KptA family)
MHRTKSALTQARSIFNRSASMRNCSVMELLNLLWRTAPEPNGAAIGECGWFTVYRLTDAERVAIVPVEQADLSSTVLVS